MTFDKNPTLRHNVEAQFLNVLIEGKGHSRLSLRFRYAFGLTLLSDIAEKISSDDHLI